MHLNLRIFISSPGDVMDERMAALDIINQIDDDPAIGDHISIEAVAWDKPGSGTPLLATTTPQQAINEGLARPSECDIVIVIFGSRMGTPLPEEYKKPDGSRFMSGTEWEYWDAMQAAEAEGTPTVIVYRSEEEVLLNPNHADFMEKYKQWQLVQDFFADFTNEDGSLRQGYNTFTDSDDFSAQLHNHLRNIIVRMLETQDITDLDTTTSASQVSSEPALLRQIRQSAKAWQTNDFSEDYLWIGKKLEDARQFVLDTSPQLTEIEQSFLQPEQERLLDEVQDPNTPDFRRALIGERLAEIGDERSGVGVLPDGTPDIFWCNIEGGSVDINNEKTELAVPEITFDVEPFRLAKYAITYSQFQAFLDADDGASNAQWWEGIGTHRNNPKKPRPFDNHPVEFVSWYDATAFCRWLSSRLGYTVRLPLEWEWHYAAMGGQSKNKYPWGESYQQGLSNNRDSDLLRTTAVGMYPHGASVFGVMDMIGNVWEWCQNELEQPTNIEFANKKKRCLKGCSCLSRNKKSYIAYRAGNYPNRRSEAHGFRVATSFME